MGRVRTVREGRESDSDWYPLWLNDHAYDSNDYGAWVVLREHLENATATDLRHYLENRDESEIWISDEVEAVFDPDYAETIDPIFELRDGRLLIRVQMHLSSYLYDFDTDESLQNE